MATVDATFTLIVELASFQLIEGKRRLVYITNLGQAVLVILLHLDGENLEDGQLVFIILCFVFLRSGVLFSQGLMFNLISAVDTPNSCCQ